MSTFFVLPIGTDDLKSRLMVRGNRDSNFRKTKGKYDLGSALHTLQVRDENYS